MKEIRFLEVQKTVFNCTSDFFESVVVLTMMITGCNKNPPYQKQRSLIDLLCEMCLKSHEALLSLCHLWPINVACSQACKGIEQLEKAVLFWMRLQEPCAAARLSCKHKKLSSA